MIFDDVLGDMILGTCWSNVDKVDTFIQNPAWFGVCASDVRDREWTEIGNTKAILALPGFNKNDVAVRIEGQALKVDVLNWNGKIKYAGKTYKLVLGDHVNREAVSAHMENGLLIVEYPSKPEYQRTIEIK